MMKFLTEDLKGHCFLNSVQFSADNCETNAKIARCKEDLEEVCK